MRRALPGLAGLVSTLAASIAAPDPAFAQPPANADATAGEEPGEGGLEEAPPGSRVACLDESDEEGRRRKGVQPRDFQKRLRFELAGVGGLYASDVLSSTYTYGGALSFFPVEDFGVEVLLTRAPVEFRLEEPFTAFDQARRFEAGHALSLMGALLFSPFHAKFKATDTTIVHGDLFLIAGAGRTDHASVQGLSWQVGIGWKLYLWRYLGFRLDVRDVVQAQEVLGRGRITHNVAVLAGFGGWIL
jgi:outer membrane beta-barrel protein